MFQPAHSLMVPRPFKVTNVSNLKHFLITYLQYFFPVAQQKHQFLRRLRSGDHGHLAAFFFFKNVGGSVKLPQHGSFAIDHSFNVILQMRDPNSPFS